jgi:hypothetical protein
MAKCNHNRITEGKQLDDSIADTLVSVDAARSRETLPIEGVHFTDGSIAIIWHCRM